MPCVPSLDKRQVHCPNIAPAACSRCERGPCPRPYTHKMRIRDWVSNLSTLSERVQGFVGRLFGLDAVCSAHLRSDTTVGRLAGEALTIGPTQPSEQRANMKTRQFLIALLLLGPATATPVTDALAQTARGAASGAIIGGAVGGRRGAAIGAAAGAVAGANRQHRNWHNYYWRNGQCWYRSRNGRSHPVSHRYCR